MGLGGKAPGRPFGPPFWYGNPTGGISPGCLGGNPCGYGPIPGVGGFPFGAAGPAPGCPLGVVGLLPGVPGFSLPEAPSFGLSDGVDLDDEERFDGGRSRRSAPEAAPVLSLCSPFRDIGGLGGSSSFPTSTTRSPSLFSPPSDSYKGKVMIISLKQTHYHLKSSLKFAPRSDI